MNSEQMREHARKLLALAKSMRRHAEDMYDCCHGETARDELEDAATELEKLAREVELIELEQLRLSLRSAS